MVIDSIYELQRAHRRRRVKSPRVDDFESETRRRHIHPFEVTKAFIERARRRFFDSNDVHGLHGQRRLLLLLADAFPDDFRCIDQDLVRCQLDGQLVIQPLHRDALQGVANETDLKLHRKLSDWQQKLSVKIRCDPCRRSLNDDICRKYRVAQFRIYDTTSKHLLRIKRTGQAR